MKFYYIALNDLKSNLKDKKAIIGLIVMPIVIILILGFALGPFFKSKEVVRKFPITIINKDNGVSIHKLYRKYFLRNKLNVYKNGNINFGNMFYNAFQSKEIKKSIETRNLNKLEAIKNIKSSKIVALIEIPADFTEKFFKGEKVDITIVGDKSQAIKLEIVKKISENFCNRLNLVQYSTTHIINNNDKNYIKNKDLLNEIKNIGTSIQGSEKVILYSEIKNNKKDVSAFQYYVAAMTVMFILFTGSRGVYSIFLEKENQTFQRMISCGVETSHIIIGKFLGILFTGFLQLTFIILFTKIFFKVQWGSSILGIIWISITSVFCMSGFSMLIASIAKDRQSADNINNIGINIMSLLGGSFFPIYSMPFVIKIFSQFTINGESIRGYMAVMENLGYASWLMPGIYLAASGFLFLSISITKLKFLD